MLVREKLARFCEWDGCDQDPVYCPGHALEYANVSDENEAIRLRHENGHLRKVLEDLVERCDGAEGVRADGSNICTIWARAVLEEIQS